MDMVDYLKKQQKDENLIDLTFAQKIGISRPMWQAIRTGRRNMGRKAMLSSIKAYPDIIKFFTS